MTTFSPMWTRRDILALAPLAVIGLIGGCATGAGAVATNNGGQYRYVNAQSRGELLPPAERQSAPSFTGTLLDGARFASSSMAGQSVVLNFWGSWCPPCRVEAPDLQAVYAAHKDDGVEFLGVNVKDDRQLALAFQEDFGITYPSLFDPRSEVALVFRDFPAEAIPSTIVIDRDGKVAAVYLGQISRETLDKAVTAVLSESD